MTLNNFFYSLITLLLLSSCASSKIDKILKQGDVLQENFKTTIPFTYANGWIVLEVEINGKTCNFILDTGASNLLTKELATEINVKTLGAEELKDVNSKGVSTEYTRVENIKIGNIDFQNTIAGIVDLNEVPEISCTNIDGIIGSNLMRKAVWDFDFKNQQITISNSEEALEIPEEVIASKIFIGTAGIPSLTIKINGKKTLNNVVDFGNSGTNLLRADYFKKQRDANLIKQYVKGTEKAFGGLGRSENKPFAHTIIDQLEIGDHAVNKIFTSVKSGGGNNIGLAFFKNYRVILNWHTKRIKMIEISKAGNDSYETYGFSTLYEDQGLYINAIIENSNTAKFLKQGDKVLSINDNNYANITKKEYCDFLNSGFDTNINTLSIRVLRNGKEFTFELRKVTLKNKAEKLTMHKKT